MLCWSGSSNARLWWYWRHHAAGEASVWESRAVCTGNHICSALTLSLCCSPFSLFSDTAWSMRCFIFWSRWQLAGLWLLAWRAGVKEVTSLPMWWWLLDQESMMPFYLFWGQSGWEWLGEIINWKIITHWVDINLASALVRCKGKVEGVRSRDMPTKTLSKVVGKDCQAQQLCKEDTADHRKWKKN